jgi:hypothetical protein
MAVLETLTAIGTFLKGAGAAKQAFDPEGGGGGGGVSSQTQTGNTQLQFTPVGLETLDIPDFDYAFIDQIYQDEEARQNQQQMRYGGPLYAAGGMPIGKSFGAIDETYLNIKSSLSKKQDKAIQNIIAQKRIEDYSVLGRGINMADKATSLAVRGNTDIVIESPSEKKMYITLGQQMLDGEKRTKKDAEESIVPGLESGGGIGDLYDPNILIEDLELELPEPPTPEDFIKNAAEIERQNKIDFAFQTIEDIGLLMNEAAGFKKAFDPEKTGGVKGRGSVIPGAAAGGFRSKPNKLAIEEIGINPFEYRAMKGGGGVLNREMFAQNYMPNGGDIKGPGGPKDDLIPVMASNGEFMLSKAAVDQAGGGNHSKGIAKLEAFNNLGNRRYG